MRKCLRCNDETTRLKKGKPLCRPCDSVHSENKKEIKQRSGDDSSFYNFWVRRALSNSKLVQIFSKIILKIFYIK